MSNVTLSIGGRDFRVGCRDGQEDQIRKLGELIDDKVREANVHQRAPSEMLLFAALLLADELKSPPTGSGEAPRAETGAASGETLAKIADRLESLASQLEQATLNT